VFDFSPLAWALIALGAFGNGFLFRTFGSGVGVTLMPILTLVFPAKFSLVFLALCTTLVSIGLTREMWRLWDRRFTFIFFPGMVAGVLLAGWILLWISEPALRTLIGAACLTIAFYQMIVEIRGRSPEVPRIPVWAGVCVGPFSGMSSTLANAGATILVPIMVGQKISPHRIVGTIWALFFLLNPMRLGVFWNADILTPAVVTASLIMIPLIWAGVWTGAWLQPKLPQRVFNLSVLTIALVGSLRLLIAG
jgi:hypothetical protein